MAIEQKYQIFISSTYSDLKEERKKITEQILKDENFPIGMEMFKADDQSQWDVIRRTIDSSDIYILILGYRYGSIEKSTGLSYTEKEYNYALSKGIPILRFFLQDENFEKVVLKLKRDIDSGKKVSESSKALYKEITDRYFDENQQNIRNFKARALMDRLGEPFTRTAKLNYRQSRLQLLNTTISVAEAINSCKALLPNNGWVRQAEYRAFQSLEKTIIDENPGLFHLARTENMEYARVLPDGQSLVSETSFGDIIDSAEQEFCAFTTSLKVFYDNEQKFLNAVRRGVQFKILLIDAGSENNLNDHWIYHSNPSMKEGNRMKHIGDHQAVVLRLRNLKRQVETENLDGNVDLRLYKRPLTYQGWIKDPFSETGLGHLNVVHFLGFKPHFRITPKTSRRLFNSFVKEFFIYWEDSENEYVAL